MSGSNQNVFGAMLLHERRSIGYQNRILGDVEIGYALVERKLLTVVFSLLIFCIYAHNRRTAYESDHLSLNAYD